MFLCVCSCQTVKTREEKEVLEHFAGVVSNIQYVYTCTLFNCVKFDIIMIVTLYMYIVSHKQSLMLLFG